MRYFKCISRTAEGIYQDIKEGKIYEVLNTGFGLKEDCGFIWEGRTVLPKTPRSFDKSDSNAKFEEVSRGEYLIQMLFDGKIGVEFLDRGKCERFAEEMRTNVRNKGLRNDQSFCGGGIYYIFENEVRFAHVANLIKTSLSDGIMVVEDSMFNIEGKEERKEYESFGLSDIKDGMIVETKSEGFAMLLGSRLLFEDGNIDFVQYEEDLKLRSYFSGRIQPEFEIVAVYKASERISDFHDLLDDEDKLELVWKKETVKDSKKYGSSELGVIVEPVEDVYYDSDDTYDISISDFDGDLITIDHEGAARLVEYLTDILENAKANEESEEDDDEDWDF